MDSRSVASRVGVKLPLNILNYFPSNILNYFRYSQSACVVRGRSVFAVIHGRIVLRYLFARDVLRNRECRADFRNVGVAPLHRVGMKFSSDILNIGSVEMCHIYIAFSEHRADDDRVRLIICRNIIIRICVSVFGI